MNWPPTQQMAFAVSAISGIITLAFMPSVGNPVMRDVARRRRGGCTHGKSNDPMATEAARPNRQNGESPATSTQMVKTSVQKY